MHMIETKRSLLTITIAIVMPEPDAENLQTLLTDIAASSRQEFTSCIEALTAELAARPDVRLITARQEVGAL